MKVKYYIPNRTNDDHYDSDSILRVVWNGDHVVMSENYCEPLGKWMAYPTGHVKSFLVEFDYREATEDELMLEIL